AGRSRPRAGSRRCSGTAPPPRPAWRQRWARPTKRRRSRVGWSLPWITSGRRPGAAEHGTAAPRASGLVVAQPRQPGVGLGAEPFQQIERPAARELLADGLELLDALGHGRI